MWAHSRGTIWERISNNLKSCSYTTRRHETDIKVNKHFSAKVAVKLFSDVSKIHDYTVIQIPFRKSNAIENEVYF